MKHLVLGGVMTAAMLATGAAQAEMGLGLGVKAGTLGFGAEITKSFTETLNGRVGFNSYKFTTSGKEGDVDYDIDMKWQSTALLLDWHPGGGSFRLTAGYMLNGNKLEMKAKPAVSYTVGDTTYSASDIADLSGTVDFSDGPYIGLGWGNSARKGFGFSFELGAVYQDAPNVKLVGNCTAGSPVCDDFYTELAKEQQKAKDSLDSFKWYPQIAIGISYGF